MRRAATTRAPARMRCMSMTRIAAPTLLWINSVTNASRAAGCDYSGIRRVGQRRGDYFGRRPVPVLREATSLIGLRRPATAKETLRLGCMKYRPDGAVLDL